MAAATDTAHYLSFGNRGVQQEARIYLPGRPQRCYVDRHHSIMIPLRIHISVQNILVPVPAQHQAAVLQQLMEALPTRHTVRVASHTEHHGGCSGVYTSSDKHKDRQPSQLSVLGQWQQRLNEGGGRGRLLIATGRLPATLAPGCEDQMRGTSRDLALTRTGRLLVV
ncbi:hypothetical protein GGI42DRAFT_232209 [Trichoderma sp. SZMC 28013]